MHKTKKLKNDQQLIVFIKAPIPGQCKTRLIPYMSAQAASEFYMSLVRSCLDNIKSLDNTDIAIYTYPDLNHPFISEIKQKYAREINLQKGDDLGERMHHALQHSLKNYSKAVLIGTDCPVMDKDYIEQAFNQLNKHEMVYGPSEDGGYVLVGATQVSDAVFSNINWGTDKVLEQSLQNINATNYNVHILATLWDIDTPEDYIKYQQIHIKESA